MKLIKLPRVLLLNGKSRSTFYHEVNIGLMPPPVKLGKNSAAWPEYEIVVINAAYIAGKSRQEIMALVKQLVQDRAKLPSIVSNLYSYHQPVEITND